MSGAGHGHGGEHGGNKGVALLISVLALVLAFSETLGKSAQTTALNQNVEASNLWSFFQAKTIRMTTVRTAADGLTMEASELQPGPAREAREKRAADLRAAAARYDSEPETQEGRKELAARAKVAEEKRERSLAAYHQYEIASAAVQIAIVLASANVITGAAFLLWGTIGLGIVGVIFSAIGLFAPTAVHLF